MTDTTPLDDMIVCPTCDLVYSAPRVALREKAVCLRCGTVLVAPRRKAGGGGRLSAFPEATRRR